jgi:hypothetical protein
MSFTLNNEIRYADSPNLDAFGRLRTSNPEAIFASTHIFDSGYTYYDTFLSGGTVTFNQSKSEMQFNVTANGNRVLREQHGYNYYQPGKSQLVFLTGVFGTATTGVRKKMGYYNDDDGLFFESSGTTFGAVLRTSTSGVPVDTFVPQSSWNIDTLITGSTLNPSGIHLDITKTQIFIINFQWLGVGRVVYALDIDGVIVPVHQILNANNKTSVYMKTGNLPVRYEVTSQGGSDSTFKQICASVVSEGGVTPLTYSNIVSNGLTTRTFSSRQSVISLRLSNNFNGQTNRVIVEPDLVNVVTTTATVSGYWELVLQRGYLSETNLGGSPTWTSLSGSPIEYSVNGTTITGGIVVDSGFIIATNQAGEKTSSSTIVNKNKLALSWSGGNSDYLHLIVTPSANSSWSGKIQVKTLF